MLAIMELRQLRYFVPVAETASAMLGLASKGPVTAEESEEYWILTGKTAVSI